MHDSRHAVRRARPRATAEVVDKRRQADADVQDGVHGRCCARHERRAEEADGNDLQGVRCTPAEVGDRVNEILDEAREAKLHLTPAIPFGNLWASCYFAMTGFHALHVFGGLVIFAIILLMGLREQARPAAHEHAGADRPVLALCRYRVDLPVPVACIWCDDRFEPLSAKRRWRFPTGRHPRSRRNSRPPHDDGSATTRTAARDLHGPT